MECKIRLIKEWGRGILNILLFKKMPRLMLIELIYHVGMWLNALLEPYQMGTYIRIHYHKFPLHRVSLQAENAYQVTLESQ